MVSPSPLFRARLRRPRVSGAQVARLAVSALAAGTLSLSSGFVPGIVGCGRTSAPRPAAPAAGTISLSSGFVPGIVGCGRTSGPRPAVTAVRGFGRPKEAVKTGFEDFAKVPVHEWFQGTVKKVEPTGAHVIVTLPDSGAQAKGFLHISELRRGYVKSVRAELEKGQEVRVRVLWVDMKRRQMKLSMLQLEGDAPELDDLSAFQGISRYTWFSGKVAKTAPFGAFVTVTLPNGGAQADGLVHISQFKDGFVRSVEDEVKVGQDVQVRVVSVDMERNNMALSMRELKGGVKEASAFENIPSDMWLSGKVTVTNPSGAYVAVTPPDGGAQVDGFIHKSQLKDGFVERTEDEVQEGQEVRVRVMSVHVEKNGLLNLSMKPAVKAAALSAFEGISSDVWLSGRVVRTQDYGAFVEVTPPDGSAPGQGMVHVREFNKDGFVERVDDEVEIGQEVQVRVLQVDMERNRLALSMRQPADRFGAPLLAIKPVLSAFEGISSDVWLSGKVVSTTHYGAFVEVTPPDGSAPGEGLVHITQLNQNGFVERVEDEVEIGQEVQVRVVQVDMESNRMALSMRQPAGGSTNALAAFEGISPYTWLRGRVVKTVRTGFFATVTPPGGGAQVTGFVDISKLKDDAVERIEDEVEFGQEVQVRVEWVDAQKQRLNLSMRPPKGDPRGEGPVDFSAFEAVSPDTWLSGTVFRTVSYGAFVRVALPDGIGQAKGIIPLSQMKSRDDSAARVEDVVTVGQDVQVRVLSVEKGRMSLSMRAADEQ